MWGNSSPNVQAPEQAPCELIEATTDQCNITSNEARPLALTVTNQLNGQDIGLLVDPKVSMSAIDEQLTRDLFDGKLPRLRESPRGYQFHSPLENVRSFKASDKFSPAPHPDHFLDTNLPLFAKQEQINELGKKLDGIVRSVQPKQEANDKWR